MDRMNDLTTGAKLVLGATIAFLIVSFFHWQEVDLGVVEVGRNMWHGWGVLAGLLAILLLAWEALRLASVKIDLPVSASMAGAVVAALVALATILKFLVDNEFRTFWAWLGLAFAIVIVVGAWLNMQAAGESLGDVRTQFAGAAAAARGAVDRGDEPASTPPAPSEPADAPADDPDAPRAP
jgi:cation transport ATPase